MTEPDPVKRVEEIRRRLAEGWYENTDAIKDLLALVDASRTSEQMVRELQTLRVATQDLLDEYVQNGEICPLQKSPWKECLPKWRAVLTALTTSGRKGT